MRNSRPRTQKGFNVRSIIISNNNILLWIKQHLKAANQLQYEIIPACTPFPNSVPFVNYFVLRLRCSALHTRDTAAKKYYYWTLKHSKKNWNVFPRQSKGGKTLVFEQERHSGKNLTGMPGHGAQPKQLTID